MGTAKWRSGLLFKGSLEAEAIEKVDRAGLAGLPHLLLVGYYFRRINQEEPDRHSGRCGLNNSVDQPIHRSLSHCPLAQLAYSYVCPDRSSQSREEKSGAQQSGKSHSACEPGVLHADLSVPHQLCGLGKLYELSEPQFPHLYMKMKLALSTSFFSQCLPYLTLG